MHIPACDTTCLELVRFDAALEAANRPSPDYDITKVSTATACKLIREVLNIL